MFIPDPRSEFFPARIPETASKNLSILAQKMVFKLSEILSGLFISDPDFLLIPDTGCKGQKGIGSRIRIRNIDRDIRLISCIYRLE
jgi:hypothetical protein